MFENLFDLLFTYLIDYLLASLLACLLTLRLIINHLLTNICLFSFITDINGFFENPTPSFILTPCLLNLRQLLTTVSDITKTIRDKKEFFDFLLS